MRTRPCTDRAAGRDLRLKRVAADHKHDIAALLPPAPIERNGKRVACVGAGPASLTVARDLAAIGYEVVVFNSNSRAGGIISSQIPKFPPARRSDRRGGRLRALDWRRVRRRTAHRQPQGLPREGYDAIFVGCGARADAISIYPAAQRHVLIDSGFRPFPSAMSRRSAGGSSCSAAATPPWIAAGPRAVSAAQRPRSSCAPASPR